MNKDETAIAVGLGLLALGGAKALASKGPNKAPPVPLDPGADGAALVKRANQQQAQGWVADFTSDLGHVISPETAKALARWAGIESSGNPTAKSRLDERGLLQAGPSSVSEGLLTQGEWAALVDPKTSRAAHAALAIKYADGLAKKALTYVLPAADPIDLLWYAKLWHQRPVDVRDVVGPLTHQLSTSNARTIAQALASTWTTDPKAMHRLRAANVVAFGTPNP
jgi:hypothetical protein